LEKKRSSVEEIKQKFSFVRRTVQRDLLKLTTIGMIKEISKNETDPTKYYELL
jgi:predicted transcriptional regulator